MGPFRAIVIDDAEHCRDLLTLFLNERGYEVFSHPDVTTCPLFPARNATCPKQAPCADFLLLDNRLPFMAGIDFLELLDTGRCQINTTHKAIFSGYWTKQERNKAAQLNCKSFAKPYDLLSLAEWLDSREKLIPENRQLAEFGAYTSGKENTQT